MTDILTRDNLLLSGPKTSDFHPSTNVDQQSLSYGGAISEVTELVRDSISENTRRAYVSDLAHFIAWGGGIPASDVDVASYLAAHAETLSVATLSRRLSTISKSHAASSLSDLTG